MDGRVKFEVWSAKNAYWATAQIKKVVAEQMALQFVRDGFTVRVDGLTYQPVQQAKAA